jgi:Holliday junction resolvase RusA-like endonuclease
VRFTRETYSVLLQIILKQTAMKLKLTPKQKRELVMAGRTAPWSRTIFGHVQSKANSRKIIMLNGRPASIKSKSALQFVSDFSKQCPQLSPIFEGDVMVEMTIWYPSRRNDLDESLVMDCLQGRVLRNDRQIKSKRIEWALDPANPRVDIRVSLIGDNHVGSPE